jgi:hypothetical protein
MSTLGPHRGLYTPDDLATLSAKLNESASPDETADRRERRAAALLLSWNGGTPEQNVRDPDANAGSERPGAGTLLMALAALASAPGVATSPNGLRCFSWGGAAGIPAATQMSPIELTGSQDFGRLIAL